MEAQRLRLTIYTALALKAHDWDNSLLTDVAMDALLVARSNPTGLDSAVNVVLSPAVSSRERLLCACGCVRAAVHLYTLATASGLWIKEISYIVLSSIDDIMKAIAFMMSSMEERASDYYQRSCVSHHTLLNLWRKLTSYESPQELWCIIKLC